VDQIAENFGWLGENKGRKKKDLGRVTRYGPSGEFRETCSEGGGGNHMNDHKGCGKNGGKKHLEP